MNWKGATRMQGFVYNARPARVLFGSGTLRELPAEIDRLGLRRVLVLTTPQQIREAEVLSDLIGTRQAGSFREAAMHTPVTVTERAMAVVAENKIDGVLAIGGGSTTGLAKAIALRTDLPQIVVPTTYAGSEMTPIIGETKDGRKVTQSSPKVLPEVVIYDVDLTVTLPAALSVTSGINAIAHAVEALYAQDRNPIVSLMAVEGVRSMFGALPGVVRDPADVRARWTALYGAWLCGICLGSVGMALHHKICHTLGGMFDLPHAETHTAVLPHALRYNEAAAPEALAGLREATGHDDPALALFDLARKLNARTALRDLGMPENGVTDAVAEAMRNPYWNPRPLEREALVDLVGNALAGNQP